jgi:hypothetical protein
MKGIYIDLKDIMTIRGCSESRASDIIQILRALLGKKKHQKITVSEYCEYEGISVELFMKAINNKNNF